MRNMCRNIGMLLCLILTVTLLGGCSKSGGSTVLAEGSILVYYTDSEGKSILSTGYPLNSTGDEAIREILGVLQNGQFSDGRSAIPADITIDSAWQTNGLVLYLNGDYPKVGTVEELLCRYAIVTSLTQLDGVDGITFYVNDKELKESDGRRVGLMTADSFLSSIDAGAGETHSVTLTLYYLNAEGTKLAACPVNVNTSDEDPAAKQIVNLLLQNPSSGGCRSAIPSGTHVLNISTKDRICYVNLDSGFLGENSSELSKTLAVFSVVNSLTALRDVDSVQLTINGTTDVNIGENLSLAAPLTADMRYVEEQTTETSESTADEPATSEMTADEPTTNSQEASGQEFLSQETDEQETDN